MCIPISAPTEEPLSYINRKSFHCIVLQGVRNDEMLFTNTFAGFPGSVHDAHVLRRSSLLNEYKRILRCFRPTPTFLEILPIPFAYG